MIFHFGRLFVSFLPRGKLFQGNFLQNYSSRSPHFFFPLPFCIFVIFRRQLGPPV